MWTWNIIDREMAVTNVRSKIVLTEGKGKSPQEPIDCHNYKPMFGHLVKKFSLPL